jgi:hypothetical protein
MRFYWKLTPDSQDHQGVKCKMLRVRFLAVAVVLSALGSGSSLVRLGLQPTLRVWTAAGVLMMLFCFASHACDQPVPFPADNFDVFDYCAPELKALLQVNREW